MSLLYNFKNGFDYKYLRKTDIENIKTIILSNSIPFINQNRRLRLKWIKSSWKIKIPQVKHGGIFHSVKLLLVKPLVFKLCENIILRNLESYRAHGEKIFNNRPVADIKKAKNTIELVKENIDLYVKKSLEDLHNGEVERRKKAAEEDNDYNLMNSMEVKEVIFFGYERHQHFGFKECVYLGQWEYKQVRALIKKIDRTFQRFIPNQTVTIKEIANRIHDKLDELSKQIELMEKPMKLNSSLKGSKVHEIELFQLKMELQFYNHYYNYIHKQYLMDEENAKKQDDVGVMRQHNLVMYYLLEYGQLIRPDVNSTRYAKFIRFLTGISRDSIRKSWPEATFQKNNIKRKEDLILIRSFFEEIKAEGIIKMIDNDLALKFRTRRNRDGTNG